MSAQEIDAHIQHIGQSCMGTCPTCGDCYSGFNHMGCCAREFTCQVCGHTVWRGGKVTPGDPSVERRGYHSPHYA